MKSKKSSSRFSGSSDILHNKYVLYLSFFFAIVTAAGYLLRNNLEAICIFVIIGFLTTYFSKNMIIVLLVTTIATNFIVLMKNRNSSMIEGLETKEDPTATSPDGGAASSSESSVNPPSKKTNHEVDMAPVASANEVSEPFSGKKNKKTEALSNLSPAPVESEGNSMLDLQKGMASGYGAQKEQAYKALASLGGAGAGGSASNFSAETINSQNEMINNLKSIQPILDTAEKFLDKFENSSISKMVSNMGSMPGMSLLTGGLGKTASPAGPVGAES
jgi:hypothetical protein